MRRRELLLMFTQALPAQTTDQYRADRERLVREFIRPATRSGAIQQVMLETPRHEFMPRDMWSLAYVDRAIPIGFEQTISQPSLVAMMTEALDLRPTDRVLEIGTGSGYQAAVLAKLAREVYTIEIVPELAQSASATFQRLGIRNIFARAGDGYAGWPEKAPFDRVILTAAPPEIPAELVRQLKSGGKLIAPVGPAGGDQELILITKQTDGKIQRRTIIPVRFVPMVRGRKQD